MKFGRFIGWNIWFYPLILLIVFSIAILPLVVRVRGTPQDYFYTMSQGFYLDYDYYLAIMREGRYQWLTTPPFTTEAAKPTLLHIYYLYLGKAAALIGLPNTVMYYLAIFSSLGLFLLASFRLMLFLFPRVWSRVALLFLLFASSLPPFNFSGSGWKVDLHYPWWVPIGSAYHRLFWVPHHFIAQAMSVFVVYLWLAYRKKKAKLTLAVLLVLQVFGLIIFPVPGLVVTLAIVLDIGRQTALQFFQGKTQEAVETLVPIVLLGVASVLTFALLYTQVKGQTSWGAEFVGQGEMLRPHLPILPVLWDYTLAIGVLGLLVPFVWFSLKKNQHVIFFLALFLAPYILMIGAEIIGGQGTRIIGSSPFIAAAVLATMGGQTLVDWAKKYQAGEKYSRFLPLVFMLIVLVGSLPGWWYFYRTETKLEWTTNVYVPKEWVFALSYLDKTGTRGDIVLSREQVGPLIPMFTDLRPYLAHPDLTYHFQAKQKQTEDFYAARMSPVEAKEFLVKNNISFVYWGWYENDVGKKPYPYLQSIYTGNHVNLYQVK